MRIRFKAMTLDEKMKAVDDLKEKGLNGSDIARVLCTSRQNIYIILNKIEQQKNLSTQISR